MEVHSNSFLATKNQANSWLVQFYVNLCSLPYKRPPLLSEIVTGNPRHPGSGPHLLAQLLVLGFQALAVAAPWSVELNQNIFAVIIDDGVKVLCHHYLQIGDTRYSKVSGRLSPRAQWRSYLDRSIIVLWDGL